MMHELSVDRMQSMDDERDHCSDVLRRYAGVNSSRIDFDAYKLLVTYYQNDHHPTDEMRLSQKTNQSLSQSFFDLANSTCNDIFKDCGVLDVCDNVTIPIFQKPSTPEERVYQIRVCDEIPTRKMMTQVEPTHSRTSRYLSDRKVMVIDVDNGCSGVLRSFGGKDARVDFKNFISMITYYGGGTISEEKEILFHQAFNDLATEYCNHFVKGQRNYICDNETIPYIPKPRSVEEKIYQFKVCEETMFQAATRTQLSTLPPDTISHTLSPSSTPTSPSLPSQKTTVVQPSLAPRKSPKEPNPSPSPRLNPNPTKEATSTLSITVVFITAFSCALVIGVVASLIQKFGFYYFCRNRRNRADATADGTIQRKGSKLPHQRFILMSILPHRRARSTSVPQSPSSVDESPSVVEISFEEMDHNEPELENVLKKHHCGHNDFIHYRRIEGFAIPTCTHHDPTDDNDII